MTKPRFVVRAVDIGYGNTKFVTGRPASTNSIDCDIFPSPRALSSTQTLAGQMASL